MLRVIAGIHRGRILKQPNLKLVRPTKDRVKEAIFSSIQFQVPNAIVLDLFSGSGSLGIEAVSRGAMKVIAIENNKDAVKTIKENIKLLDIKNIDLINNDTLVTLKLFKGRKFDLIFMDPPYNDFNLYNLALQSILESKLLKQTGLIIIETSNVNKIMIPKTFVIQKEKKYGKTTILIIANNI